MTNHNYSRRQIILGANRAWYFIWIICLQCLKIQKNSSTLNPNCVPLFLLFTTVVTLLLAYFGSLYCKQCELRSACSLRQPDYAVQKFNWRYLDNMQTQNYWRQAGLIVKMGTVFYIMISLIQVSYFWPSFPNPYDVLGAMYCVLVVIFFSRNFHIKLVWTGIVMFNLVNNVETLLYLIENFHMLLTATWNRNWNMRNAWKTANCSFPGITHISDMISMCC